MWKKKLSITQCVVIKHLMGACCGEACLPANLTSNFIPYTLHYSCFIPIVKTFFGLFAMLVNLEIKAYSLSLNQKDQKRKYRLSLSSFKLSGPFPLMLDDDGEVRLPEMTLLGK